MKNDFNLPDEYEISDEPQDWYNPDGVLTNDDILIFSHELRRFRTYAEVLEEVK